MPRLPISLVFLLLFAVLVGLQAIPVLGILLAMFGSIFIAGLLLHAFLAGLAVESITGRVWRGLIAIPILAYGGYYAIYAAQRYEIAQKSAEMRAANPQKIFDFDLDRHSLVMANAGSFVASHEIPVAYESNPNFPEGNLAHRLIARDQCNIKRDTQARIMTSGVHHDGKFQQQLCHLRMPEAPAHQIVMAIKHGNEEIWKRKREIMEQTTDLVFDGKVIGSYRTASVWRLPSFPLVMIGCGLVSSGPAWKCDYGFWRSWGPIDSVPDGVDRAKYDTPVSVMLGLRRYTATDLADFRGFPQNAAALASAADEPTRVEDGVFAVLQLLLDGRNPAPPHNMGYSIAANPQRLAPLARAIVSRFAELAALSPNTPNREAYMDALATGIAALPRSAFAAIAQQVFDLVHQPKVAERYQHLVLRAADAGAHTFGFYKSAIMANRQNRVLRPVLALAVCRIGSADDETIAEFKRRFLDDGQDHLGMKPALFVTLIKLGEEPFAREHIKMLQPRLAQWADAVLAGEGTTAVGPNNCMGERWGFTNYLGPEMSPGLEWGGHKGWRRRAGT